MGTTEAERASNITALRRPLTEAALRLRATQTAVCNAPSCGRKSSSCSATNYTNANAAIFSIFHRTTHIWLHPRAKSHGSKSAHSSFCYVCKHESCCESPARSCFLSSRDASCFNVMTRYPCGPPRSLRGQSTSVQKYMLPDILAPPREKTAVGIASAREGAQQARRVDLAMEGRTAMHETRT